MTAFIGGGTSNEPKMTPCNDMPPISMLAPRHPNVSIKTLAIGGHAKVAENTKYDIITVGMLILTPADSWDISYHYQK